MRLSSILTRSYFVLFDISMHTSNGFLVSFCRFGDKRECSGMWENTWLIVETSGKPM